MSTRVMLGLLTALAVVLIVAVSWGWQERTERQQLERFKDSLQTRLDAQAQALERTEREVLSAGEKVARLQEDFQEVAERAAKEARSQQEKIEGLLVEGATLHDRQKALDRQVEEAQAKADALNDSLSEQQALRQRTEAQLAAERDGAQTALRNAKQEAARARDLARKNEEALRESRGEEEQLKDQAEQAASAAQTAEAKNARLSNDLYRSLAERDSAFWQSQQAQQVIASALDQLQAKDAQIQTLGGQVRRLQRELDLARGEGERLKAANRDLAAQVQTLQAEVTRLKKLLGQRGAGTTTDGGPGSVPSRNIQPVTAQDSRP